MKRSGRGPVFKCCGYLQLLKNCLQPSGFSDFFLLERTGFFISFGGKTGWTFFSANEPAQKNALFLQ